MKRTRFAYVAGFSIIAPILASVLFVYLVSSYKLEKRYIIKDVDAIHLSNDSTTILKGQYLATVTNCTMCHGQDLTGAVYYDGTLGTISGGNLTTGKGSRVLDYTVDDWVRAIKHGVGKNNKSLLVMPSEVYAKMNQEDVTALISYLTKLPPIDREVKHTTLKFPARALLAIGKLPLLAAEKAKKERGINYHVKDSISRGNYLADIYSCKSCHGANMSGGKQMGIPGAPKSTNLTPNGIGSWSKEDFVRAMQSGIKPNGTVMNDVMPWRNYGRLSDEDLNCIWIYIKQLQSLPTGTK